MAVEKRKYYTIQRCDNCSIIEIELFDMGWKQGDIVNLLGLDVIIMNVTSVEYITFDYIGGGYLRPSQQNPAKANDLLG